MSDGDITITGSRSLYVESRSKAGLCRVPSNNGSSGPLTTGGTVNITNSDSGNSVSRRGSGVEIGKGAKVTVSSNTKSGQAVVSKDSPLKIGGELMVDMENEAPAGSAALYAPSYDITGKVSVTGGSPAFDVNGGGAAALRGAEINVSNCATGFQCKVELANSLMEISTKSRAFNSTVTASLADDYEVRSGASAADATLLCAGLSTWKQHCRFRGANH